MKKYKRIFLFVLDSFGIGAMPDALQYGDAGANTFATVAKDPAYHCPTLKSFGLLNVDHICLGHPVCTPFGAFARMTEASHGKDTIIGHWEMCGVISEHDLPTYPNGFPEELLARFKLAVGRDILCNRPYSGTKVILLNCPQLILKCFYLFSECYILNLFITGNNLKLFIINRKI